MQLQHPHRTRLGLDAARDGPGRVRQARQPSPRTLRKPPAAALSLKTRINPTMNETVAVTHVQAFWRMSIQNCSQPVCVTRSAPGARPPALPPTWEVCARVGRLLPQPARSFFEMFVPALEGLARSTCLYGIRGREGPPPTAGRSPFRNCPRSSATAMSESMPLSSRTRPSGRPAHLMTLTNRSGQLGCC
jgi:hypothetical protein